MLTGAKRRTVSELNISHVYLFVRFQFHTGNGIQIAHNFDIVVIFGRGNERVLTFYYGSVSLALSPCCTSSGRNALPISWQLHQYVVGAYGWEVEWRATKTNEFIYASFGLKSLWHEYRVHVNVSLVLCMNVAYAMLHPIPIRFYCYHFYVLPLLHPCVHP